MKYSLDSDWTSGYVSTIYVTNNKGECIEDWVLEFDFDREITEIWNGIIESHDGTHYVIKNAGYNSNIQSGSTIGIGFKGDSGKSDDEPYNFELYSYCYATDGEGANDYWEINYGYNPVEYNEKFLVKKSVEGIDTSVEVEIEANGDVIESFSCNVRNNDLLYINQLLPGYIGSGYDFELEGEFEHVFVKYMFDESNLEIDDFNPTICYYNESNNELEEIETV